MSDLKFFRIAEGRATEMKSGTVALEKSLQTLIEKNMQPLFGVTYLASEFATGAKHGGRIDSLGIDENRSPVIFEYKRSMNENVINQGLFYLDWLMDHRGDFSMLTQNVLGSEEAAKIDWSAPRLVCVASDFTKYDEYAIEQIGRSIELVRYRYFGEEMLALDLVASMSNQQGSGPRRTGVSNTKKQTKDTQIANVTRLLNRSSNELKDLYSDLDAAIGALGDDITTTTRQDYFAYRRIKNFACVEVHPQAKSLLVYLKVNPETVDLVDGFSRDVRSIGHFGTGDLEIRISNSADLANTLPFLQQSYEAS